MKEKNQVVPDEVLSKEFLSQFMTEADVSKFLKQLHAQMLEKMPELVQLVPLKHIVSYLYITSQSLSRIRAELAKSGK